MYQDKTLVVFFCMHRSGSSFATSVFQRLGMSLGPFELLGANESNPHGHFEAAPIVALAQKLQSSALGFDGDFPRDRAGLQRFVEGGGKWPADSESLARQRHRGRRLIQQLVASGPVTGFKDPRTVLTWPYWESVLKDFPGLRVAALFLLRSPHEIAMSMFQRSRGDCSYEDALDVTAVHFRRMKQIFDQWPGNRAVLQFEPRAFARRAPAAAAMCGLEWDPAGLADLYDPQSRHHSPVRIAQRSPGVVRGVGRRGRHRPRDFQSTGPAVPRRRACRLLWQRGGRADRGREPPPAPGRLGLAGRNAPRPLCHAPRRKRKDASLVSAPSGSLASQAAEAGVEAPRAGGR